MRLNIKTADSMPFNPENYPQGTFFVFTGGLYKVASPWSDGSVQVFQVLHGVDVASASTYYACESFGQEEDGKPYRRVDSNDIEIVVS